MVDNIARWLVIIGLALLPFSPTFSEGIVGAAILTLFGGQLREKINFIFTYPSTYWILGFLLWLGISVFYSPFGIVDGFHYYYKYLYRFLSLLLVLPLFTKIQWRERAVHSLFLGAVVSVGLSHWLYYPPIPYSIYLAIISFIALHYAIDSLSWKRWGYGFVFLCFFVFIFFVNRERTGMLVCFALLVVLMAQRAGMRGALIGLITLTGLMGIFYFISPVIHSRMNQIITDVKTYKPNSWSSVGLRYNYLKYSIPYIVESPLRGHGMGSFVQGNVNPIDPALQHKRTDPENSYLQIMLQTGAIGLLLFLGWLWTSLSAASHLPRQEKFLFQGVMLGLMVGALTVSAFIINLSATTFVTLYAVLFSARALPTPAVTKKSFLTPLHVFKRLLWKN